ncbi:MAG TPA: hypothetical protein VM658_13680 [bacterium]|nr:hypothetical protein [bacterium]
MESTELKESHSIDDSSRWRPLRRELLNWFRTNASPLAEAYEGAIRLIEDGDFPGRVHFIAHAVRDISDRLVYVLDPQLKAGRVQYENEMDRIEKLWPTELMSIRDTQDAAAEIETVRIDHKVASIIDSLVKAHRERRQRPSNYELLFRYLMRKEPFQAEVNQRLVMDFKRMRDWFMNLTHLRDKKVPQVDESELQTQFKKFEGMLHSFVGNFFTGKKELDEILRQTNR